MDPGTVRRAPFGGGHKGLAQRAKKQDQQGDSDALKDPSTLVVPTARRTAFRRCPRDLSQDCFLQELFSTKGPLTQVSVDTPKEREVAEALYSLANLFHAASPPEDKGSADYHPQKPTFRRNSVRSRGSDLPHHRDTKCGVGKTFPHSAGCQSPHNKVRSTRGQLALQKGNDSESDITDSDGASASWKDIGEAGGKTPHQIRAQQGREEKSAGSRLGEPLGRLKRHSSGGLYENGESVGNSQVSGANGDGSLRCKHGVDRSLVFTEGEVAIPRAKRTRTTTRKVVWSGDSTKPDGKQGVKDAEAKPPEGQKPSDMVSQQPPSLQTIMDAIQGAYMQGLLGSVLNRPAKDQSLGSLSNSGVGTGNTASGGLSPSPLPFPLSMPLDVQAMLQMRSLIGRSPCVPGHTVPPPVVCDKAVPVPANLRRSFARNCAHIYIAQFIRWHKYQLHQEGKSPLGKSGVDAASYAVGPHDGHNQLSQPQQACDVKPPGQTLQVSCAPVTPNPQPQSSPVQVSRPVMAAWIPTGEKSSAPRPPSSVVAHPYNPPVSSPFFPMPPFLHGNMNPTSMPSPGQPTVPPGGNLFAPFSSFTNATTPASANASSSGDPNAMLSALQIQCRRPPATPAGIPSINDVISGGSPGGNLLRTEMARQLLMSMGGVHSTDAMTWLQYLAAGCTPDGKPLSVNPAPPLGILPNQFMPDGFK